uniref:E3 ubiquitin protein ligase n=1 Tax=Caenorhabditis tropicalis TaxID=1561998 RepID=A0A1I7TBF7_9PELO
MELQIHNNVTIDSIVHSEEYKTLKKYYSLAIKEFERVSKDLEEVTNERDSIRNVKDTRAALMAEEQQKTMKEIQLQSDIHNTFYRISHDSEVLRSEFETIKEEYNKAVKQSEWDEMKATLNTFRAMNTTMKAELERIREKEKAGQKELQQLRSELKTLKEKQSKCFMVAIEGPEIPKPPADDKQQVEIVRLRTELRRAVDGKRIKEEIESRIADQLAELETLRKANETLTNDEQCISDELESVCIAVEEEQERNAQLFIEKREQEDRNLKMMNERMIQNQVLNKLRDKLDALESKAQTDAQIVKIHEYEKKTSEEKISKLNDAVQFKTSEITRLTNLIELHRKQMQDMGKARDDYKNKAERSEEQFKQFQESYSMKSKEIDDLKYKRSRLEEELDTLRTRQERSKRNDACVSQTGDQVLEEANRQMKETLTCPSCKTRPKDCIMLKCYHLFCETCIKTMYDTRQRKCPKCNSNFGANDFHRIFI